MNSALTPETQIELKQDKCCVVDEAGSGVVRLETLLCRHGLHEKINNGKNQ